MDMNVILSLIFYFCIGVACIIAAKRADKHPKLSFWFIVIVLTLLAGLRHVSVGIDTQNYFNNFTQFESGYKSTINNINEPAFLMLSYVILKLTGSFNLLLTVYALIINYFMIKRLFDMKNEIALPWALYMFMCQYYFMSINTVRQWIATALIFYFSKYIGKGFKGNACFVIAVAVATLFHKTALLGLAILIIYYMFKKSKTPFAQVAKAAVLVMSPVAVVLLFAYMQSAYGAIYGSANFIGDVSYVNLLRLAVILILLFFTLFDEPHSLLIPDPNKTAEGNALSKQELRINSIVMLCGICCTMLVFMYRYADRVGQYFLVFEMLVLPYYIKNSRVKLFVKIFVLVLFAFLRIMSFRANGYGESVYHFAWEQVGAIIQ